MKPITELTDAELASLTPQQVSDYEDLACAEAGVPLKSALPPEPEKPSGIDPDIEVFVVPETYWSTREDAERVLSTIDSTAGRQQVRWDYGYTRQYYNAADSTIDIERRKAYSKYRIDGAAKELQRYDEQRSAWSKLRDAHAKSKELRDKTTEPVLQAIEAAKRRTATRERLQRQLERYLELADNDARIAARFLWNATQDKSVIRALYPEIERLATDPATLES